VHKINLKTLNLNKLALLRDTIAGKAHCSALYLELFSLAWSLLRVIAPLRSVRYPIDFVVKHRLRFALRLTLCPEAASKTFTVCSKVEVSKEAPTFKQVNMSRREGNWWS
jgi:hypothetical protein